MKNSCRTAIMRFGGERHRRRTCRRFDHRDVWGMEGDLARTIEANLGRIAHIQLADNPGRHEPGTGEINYPFLYDHIDRLGYSGWIGAEYKPKAGTEAGLSWFRKFAGQGSAAA